MIILYTTNIEWNGINKASVVHVMLHNCSPIPHFIDSFIMNFMEFPICEIEDYIITWNGNWGLILRKYCIVKCLHIRIFFTNYSWNIKGEGVNPFLQNEKIVINICVYIKIKMLR